MTGQEYERMISRDKNAFWEEAKRHTFQYFGCLGTKSIARHASNSSIKRQRTNWSAQELYSDKMPRFLFQVAKINQGPVTYLFVVEHGKHHERPHVHFLLGGVANVSLESLTNIWTKGMHGGRTDVRIFDPARDSGYTYKEIMGKSAFQSGVEHEVLWGTNLWKRDRTHNAPEQARLFEKHRRVA